MPKLTHAKIYKNIFMLNKFAHVFLARLTIECFVDKVLLFFYHYDNNNNKNLTHSYQ